LKTVNSTKAITSQTAILENQGLFNANSSQIGTSDMPITVEGHFRLFKARIQIHLRAP
jgi:hypothetical protein